MSFILDALKKSEHARQRQAGPALFEVKVVQPRRTVPIWAVAIVVLILINAITLGWILLSHPHAEPRARPLAPSSAAAVTRTPGPALQAAAAPARRGSPAIAAPSSSQPQPNRTAPTLAPRASAPPVAVQHSLAAASPGTTQSSSPADFAPALQPAARTRPSGTAESSGALPLYAKIAGEPGSTLPQLHLDLHVYSPIARKRFVMINMHKLHQGGALADGVSVVQIRPDGVVLSYQGREFLLPR